MKDGGEKPVPDDSQGWAVIAEQVMGIRRELGDLSQNLRRVQSEQGGVVRDLELKHAYMEGVLNTIKEARADLENRVREVQSKQDQAKGALWGIGALITGASGLIAWVVSFFTHKN